ncbi:MAG: SusC/RagA family TonB-linked outer membrane protein [Janthinobacterium lividum]
MKKRFTTLTGLVLVFFLFLNASFAQQRVTGKVTDATTGETLIGVSVLVKGTNNGTVTDVNGAFGINAPANSTLTFTYIGFTTQDIAVGNQTTISVKLAAAATQLAQVVVIGYGTQRRRDVTGSVASVNGAELAKQPVQTPTQALQGKVAGVQVISSGQPNSQPQVRIRGTGSVLGGANPLYVVDGVLTDDIRNINNADIVSLDVLKDASAAIYGVRGANGVIIITTRKGKNGPAVVRYDGNSGFREATNLVQMASRDQYTDYLKVANPTFATRDAAPLTSPGTTNWYDAVLRQAFYMNHNLSVSGGSDKSTYFISGNYLTDNGVVTTNTYKRFSFRSNIEINITDKLKLGTQLSLSRGTERPVPLGDTYSSVYRAAPLIIAQDGNGKYGNTAAWGNVSNPLLEINTVTNLTVNNRALGNIYAEYKPINSLTLRSAINTDIFWNKQRNYSYQFDADAKTFTVGGGNERHQNSNLFVQNDQSLRTIWDNTATFQKTFGKHNLTILGGFTQERLKTDLFSGSRINVPASEDQWYLDQGNPDNQARYVNSGTLATRQSFLTRVTYGYDSKYLFNASFRADGSSRFSKKYGYFPTVGAGWVISEEGFLKGNKALNYLKLRASYGLLGNDNIDPSLFIVTATNNLPYFFNNTLVLGSAIQDIKDTNLKWETTEQIDIGLEYGFLNNRLTGEMDFYNKKVRDALTNVSIPGILGDPDRIYTTNAASYRNRGFEFAAKWSDKIGDKISYYIGGNININQNRVVGLNGGQALLGGGVGGQGNVTRTDNGQPIASFYVLQATGIFQTQAEVNAAPTNTYEANTVGGLKYADINNDGKIDANDRAFSGSYQPKYYGGFSLGLTYTNFDISADFYGNWGNKIYNGKKAYRYDINDNIEAAYASNRWTAANQSNTDPAVITQLTPASTYFIESGAYLRLNNLTVGYTLPSALLKRINIARVRVYATSQNLFTAKRFSGFTPELLTSDILASGIELNGYPMTRTFSFGLNLEF